MEIDYELGNLKWVSTCVRKYEKMVWPDKECLFDQKGCESVAYLLGYLMKHRPFEGQRLDIASLCEDIETRIKKLLCPGKGKHRSEVKKLRDEYHKRVEKEDPLQEYEILLLMELEEYLAEEPKPGSEDKDLLEL
jgi:hypothetical protein